MEIWDSYWILPLLFMFHDFEELVFVPHWLHKNNPKILKGFTLFGGVDSSDVLSFGIWEEFLIYLILSSLAYVINYPLLIIAATLPYIFHLIMHIIFSLIKKGYVPGIITSIIEIPLTIIYLIVLSQSTLYPLWEWSTVVIFIFIFFLGNLKIIHWLMFKIESKLIFEK